jgi:glycine/D-amino acid oxidase-like deaminating enzyme
MKGFGKIALLFGLLGGLMAYFIVPLHFSRKRSLSPTDKAEYAPTVDYYKSHCGPVIEEIEERVRAYAHESGQDIWAGFDAMTQHGRPIIGSPTWCRYMGALWLKPS